MFDQLRTARQADADAALTQLQRAADQLASRQNEHGSVAGQLPHRQVEVDRASGQLQTQQTALAAAERDLEQPQAQLDGAQRELTAADAALDLLAGREPPDVLANGKPNPRYAAWEEQMKDLGERRRLAAAAVRDAAQEYEPARQRRDLAAGAVAGATTVLHSAQAQMTELQQLVEAAQRRVDEAAAELSTRQQGALAAQARLADLEARAARLLAQPVDRPDLELAVDAEYAELLAARQARRVAWDRRVGLHQQRHSLLDQHDALVAALRPVRDAIASWPDAARFSHLATARSALDAVIAAAEEQRTRPPAARTDDLTLSAGQLAQAVSALGAAVGQADAERTTAEGRLADAARQLREHQAKEP